MMVAPKSMLLRALAISFRSAGAEIHKTSQYWALDLVHQFQRRWRDIHPFKRNHAGRSSDHLGLLGARIDYTNRRLKCHDRHPSESLNRKSHDARQLAVGGIGGCLARHAACAPRSICSTLVKRSAGSSACQQILRRTVTGLRFLNCLRRCFGRFL